MEPTLFSALFDVPSRRQRDVLRVRKYVAAFPGDLLHWLKQVTAPESPGR